MSNCEPGEPVVAVITVVHGRHQHLQRQRESLLSQCAHLHIVVAIDDPELVRNGLASCAVASPPAGLALAAARNRGAEQAIAHGAQVLVFLDVDCLAGEGLLQRYRDVVLGPTPALWSGPVTYLPPAPRDGYRLSELARLTSPHPGRPTLPPGHSALGADPNLFWSLSFACSSAVWNQIGGFCEEYVGYGGEDTDFARQARAAGVDLGWIGGADAYHQWHPVSRPPVEHLHDIVRNANLFRRRWGETPMLGWLTEFESTGLASRDASGRWEVTGRLPAQVTAHVRGQEEPDEGG